MVSGAPYTPEVALNTLTGDISNRIIFQGTGQVLRTAGDFALPPDFERGESEAPEPIKSDGVPRGSRGLTVQDTLTVNDMDVEGDALEYECP